MIENLPDLLSLDEESLKWRRLICEMAYVLGKATLVGNPAPMVDRISKRLRNPEVGDYVFEQSTFWRHRFEDGSPVKAEGMGFLRRVADEFSYTDEEWAEEISWHEKYHADEVLRPRPTERVYYVQYGPNEADECRWHNASFEVVPLDESVFAGPQMGEPLEGGAVKFTRDSLLGGLADAGFQLKVKPSDDVYDRSCRRQRVQ